MFEGKASRLMQNELVPDEMTVKPDGSIPEFRLWATARGETATFVPAKLKSYDRDGVCKSFVHSLQLVDFPVSRVYNCKRQIIPTYRDSSNGAMIAA